MQLLRSVSLPRKAALHRDICCLSVFHRSPVPPRSGDSPLSSWGNQSHPERAKEQPYESYGMYFWLCRIRGCGTLLESLCLQVWQISGMDGITAQTPQVSEETYCHQRRRNTGSSD